MRPHSTLRSTPRRRARCAFTLLELMIVLVIIGVLGAIVGINLLGAAEKGKKSATEETMRRIRTALKMYASENSTFPPTNEGGLTLLLKGQQNILEGSTIPKDGWGREIAYYSPTPRAEWELVSLGRDGLPGTDDDVTLTSNDE